MSSTPQRIAPPAIIAQATSVLYVQIAASAKITDAERHLWENAATKAFNQLMDGVRFTRDGTDFIFPSRTRNGMAHRTNGTCDCEASTEQGHPCWHRAAKRLVLLIEDATASTAPAAPAASAAPAAPAAPRGPGRPAAASRIRPFAALTGTAQEDADALFPSR